MESLWADRTVVIIFFRRFGWLFCRQAAVEISSLQPLLQAHDISLVGIGLEELGVQEFMKEEYFTGDLYLETSRESYKALGFKSFNICSIICSLFNKTARAAVAKGRSTKMKANFKGYPYLNGGVLVVEKGGQKVLLSYKQDNPADHVENSEILKALGLQPNPIEAQPHSQTQPEKTSDNS